MIESKTQEFKNRVKDLSVGSLIQAIKKEEINYGDILAEKLKDEKELKRWLFDYKKVNTYQTQYRRNAEGRMEAYSVESGKVRPTSDGKEHAIYLLKMAKKYGSEALAEIANKVIVMLIDESVNEGHYYKTEATGNALKQVVSQNFSEVLSNYLNLDYSMMQYETLLKFLQHDSVASQLSKADGYNALKILTNNPWGNSYSSDELKKIVGYVDGRLMRMEEQMISLNDKPLEKKVRQILQTIVDNKCVDLDVLKKVTYDLEQRDSEVRHNYKAKYNHELNRYFKMFKNYNQLYEMFGKAKYRVFSELYSDLEKTYDFVNDQEFVDATRRTDKYIKMLNEYKNIINCYTGAQLNKMLRELRKEIETSFGIKSSEIIM